MEMFPCLSDLDAVNELLEVHISELHAQLQNEQVENETTTAKVCKKERAVRGKRQRTPEKVQAAQTKMRHKQQQTGTNVTGRWSKHEHELFLQGLELYGREWKKMAGLIPSRTVIQIRTHAQKYFQKLMKRKARTKSIDTVTAVPKVQPAKAVVEKKKKRPSIPDKSKLPLLICMEEREVKSKPTNAKPVADTESSKSPKKPKKPKPTVPINTGTESKESLRDGSPMSHIDLTFNFPYQFVPDSAVNLFPDLNLDNILGGECPDAIPGLVDIVSDKPEWSALPELLSFDDWNDENEDFPEFNW